MTVEAIAALKLTNVRRLTRCSRDWDSIVPDSGAISECVFPDLLNISRRISWNRPKLLFGRHLQGKSWVTLGKVDVLITFRIWLV